MKPAQIRILRVVSSPFEENSYIAHLDGSADCVVIDPGLEPEKIVDQLQAAGLRPVAILNTHAHADHIAGNAALKQQWPDAELVIGADEAYKLTDPVANLSAPFGFSVISPPADVEVADGETYTAAGIAWRVLTIAGHSAGHVVYQWEEGSPQLVFVGDVIFEGSIGRTDFPDGNMDQLVSGIRGKLFALPDDTVLLCGHGPATTVGREKRHNPFVGESARRSEEW